MATTEGSSLVAHLRHQLITHADDRTFTFLTESGRQMVAEQITFGDFDRTSRELAVWLKDHTDADRPVLLLFEPGIAFWTTFIGCLYAGVTAIPAPMPHDQRSMQRVASILSNAGASLALTTANLRDVFVSGIDALQLTDTIEVVAVGANTAADADQWEPPVISDDSVAFLQYTSGSTGDPKGVAVTHSNVVANERAMAEVTGATTDSVIVGWIPHFHDMGLIGQLIAFFNGANLVTMAPLAFLKQPVRLLRAISDHHGTITAGPNFAYDLIARRVMPEQLADINLSSLKIAINGAEPVRRRTIERLAEVLAPTGFLPSTLRPAYGMAEATLMATMCRDVPKYLSASVEALEQHRYVPASSGSVDLVSSGAPAPGFTVLIVDPETHEALPEDHVGEIWLKSDSVASGYHNRADQTAERFHAYTTAAAGPFLRTGDLGLQHDGDLFVTGRLKDLLIVNGRNLYPHDIEDFVQEVHPAIAGSRGVAVSMDANDSERLILIQAIKPELLADKSLSELASMVKVAVARGFDVAAPSVVFVDRSGIHLTTSGKVQRSSMLTAFRKAELNGVLHENIDPALAAHVEPTTGVFG